MPEADHPREEPRPPVVVVPAQRASTPPGALRAARPVERALSGPSGNRSVSWRDRVAVVPGGRGPGRAEYEERDAARAVLPLEGSRLVMVLGCTVGAGQTVTALMLADLLAGMRGQPVAAVDINPGPASLARQARTPAVTASTLLAAGPVSAIGRTRSRGRVDVIVDDAPGNGEASGEERIDRVFELLAARYQLCLADPGAGTVSGVLDRSDQLVLVAPASPDAARALAMTREWLGSNGHEDLAADSITVINGVSKRSLPHARQAELVARGRCRAIVRIPWDDHLAEPESERVIRDSRVAAGGASRAGQLRPPVRQAYTALAGVLVAALAASPQRRRAAP